MYNEIFIFNKVVYGSKGIIEKVDLLIVILYGGIFLSNDFKFVGLYKIYGKVDKRFKELSEERKNKIDVIFEEEYNKRKKEFEEYIVYLESRKGEMVVYVLLISRVSFCSVYYIGIFNKGGIREDVKKDVEKIKVEKEVVK